MTLPPAFRLTCRALGLAAWAALVLPLGAGMLAPTVVWANDDDDGDDDGGRGRGRGRGGNSDDVDHEGGQGRGRGCDSDDDDGGESGDDDRESSDDRSGGGDGDQARSQAGVSGVRTSRAGPRDIAVYYPDGWVERIVGGRYELIDDMSRLVIRRAATGEDFSRMDALR